MKSNLFLIELKMRALVFLVFSFITISVQQEDDGNSTMGSIKICPYKSKFLGLLNQVNELDSATVEASVELESDDQSGGDKSNNQSGGDESNNQSGSDHDSDTDENTDESDTEEDASSTIIDEIEEKKQLAIEKKDEIKEKLTEEIKSKIAIFGVWKEKLKDKLGIIMAGASVTASLLVLHVAVLPLVFKYSKAVQRKMVFSNCINYPRNMDYDSPSSCDVVGGRNCSVEFHSKCDKCPIKLGIWHIIPCEMFKEIFIVKDCITLDERLYDELKCTRNPVVLYCHGNSNHRASPHRLQLYKVFQELNFHVIAFDYRGYGDSTSVRPTERGVVEDSLRVYSWLINSLNKKKRPTVLLWGHSLGAAIASNLVAHMATMCKEQHFPCLPQPDALILEAAFNNLSDEIEMHPFSKLVSWLPYYKETFVNPFKTSSEYAFTTDQYLAKVPDLPILMLHSKEDNIVPYKLAEKLHQGILSSRENSSAPVVFHTFEGQGVGHNNICEAQDLSNVISNFMREINKPTPPTLSSTIK